MHDNAKDATFSQSLSPLSSNSPFFPDLDPADGLSMFDSSFAALDSSSLLSMSSEGFKTSHSTTDSLSLPLVPTQNLLSHPNNYLDQIQTYPAGDYPGNRANLSLQSCENFLTASSDTGPDAEGPALASRASSFPTLQLAPQQGAAPIGTGYQHFDSLETALRLMQQLSCGEDDLSNVNLTTVHDHQATELPQLLIVIDKNKKAMESVRSTLQTTCSHDGYLLVVVCLVVSKVLSTYATAVRISCAHENDRRRTNTSAPSSSDKKEPIAAQRVLDELYQVQASMDQLGAKMQLWAKRNGTSANETFLIGNDTSLTTLAGFPFSATVLNQLYTEVRKRLSTLSLGLIDELKRYWT